MVVNNPLLRPYFFFWGGTCRIPWLFAIRSKLLFTTKPRTSLGLKVGEILLKWLSISIWVIGIGFSQLAGWKLFIKYRQKPEAMIDTNLPSAMVPWLFSQSCPSCATFFGQLEVFASQKYCAEIHGIKKSMPIPSKGRMFRSPMIQLSNHLERWFSSYPLYLCHLHRRKQMMRTRRRTVDLKVLDGWLVSNVNPGLMTPPLDFTSMVSPWSPPSTGVDLVEFTLLIFWGVFKEGLLVVLELMAGDFMQGIEFQVGQT